MFAIPDAFPLMLVFGGQKQEHQLLSAPLTCISLPYFLVLIWNPKRPCRSLRWPFWKPKRPFRIQRPFPGPRRLFRNSNGCLTPQNWYFRIWDGHFELRSGRFRLRFCTFVSIRGALSQQITSANKSLLVNTSNMQMQDDDDGGGLSHLHFPTSWHMPMQEPVKIYGDMALDFLTKY